VTHIGNSLVTAMEIAKVETAIGAARAENQRDHMLKSTH